MSFTNKTANYDLPQYIATDKPSYLVDANGAYLAIDTAMKANATAAATAQSTADTNTSAIGTLNTQINGENGLAADLTAVETLASTTAGSVNTINSLIGNGEPTTTDKTLIGAINELNSGKADKTVVGTGTLDTTAQNCIDAINELDSKTDNVYGYNSVDQTTVTADGTKTYSQLFDELHAAMQAKISAAGTNYRYKLEDIFFNSYRLHCISLVKTGGGNMPASVAFDGVYVSSSDFIGATVTLVNSGSTFKTYNGTTVTDVSAQVPTNGTVFTLQSLVYKAN